MAPRIVNWLNIHLGHHWGGFLIPAYIIILIFGVFVIFYIVVKQEEKEGIEPNHTLNLVLLGLCFFFLGSRAFYVLIYHQYFWLHPQEIFKIWKGGFSFYGGITAGFLAGLVYIKMRGIPGLKFGDVVVPYLFLAVLCSRLGCFLKGCCYGKISSLPWAVRYPAGSYAYLDQLQAGLIESSANLSLAVHPSQLYEAMLGLVAFIFLSLFRKRKSWEGQICAMAALIYSGGRIVIDFFRAGQESLLLSLGLSQLIGLAIVILSVFPLVYFRIKKKPDLQVAH